MNQFYHSRYVLYIIHFGFNAIARGTHVGLNINSVQRESDIVVCAHDGTRLCAEAREIPMNTKNIDAVIVQGLLDLTVFAMHDEFDEMVKTVKADGDLTEEDRENRLEMIGLVETLHDDYMKQGMT